jgi:hypothetical protein
MAVIASVEAKEVDMGCWHDRHGCGPWYPDAYVRGWYGPPDWYGRSSRRADRELATEELEARLEELRAEIRHLETELTELRGSRASAGST